MDKEKLLRFLLNAHRVGYASERAEVVDEADGSRTIAYEDGDFRFRDNYFGGDPFGGNEVIFYKGRPVWMMVYYGRVEGDSVTPNDVFRFLRKALLRSPDDKPFRGPPKLTDGQWLYKNRAEGHVERFSGNEQIFWRGRKIYEARYSGGLIDVRR